MPSRSRRSQRRATLLDDLDDSTQGRADPTEGRATLDMDSLAHVLSTMRRKDAFKAPKYDGTGDVELFLQQFTDVAEANEWTARDATLHLRAHLEGTAQGCGHGATVEDIRAALRSRFGMTARQAKEKLMQLKRDASQSLHEHSTEAVRLVGLAYPTLSITDKDNMAVDYFIRSFDNKGLQRHMLAVKPTTMMEAVTATDEYLSARGTERNQKPRMMVLEEPEVSSVQTQIQEGLVKLMEAMQVQSNLLAEVVRGLPDRSVAVGVPLARKKPLTCYQCGGPHLVRNCSQGRVLPGPGNGSGPSRM